MSLRILLALAIILLAAPSAPNDPSFDRQWALRKVGALCAWDRTTGSAEVIVAVVDSGVDPTHPDLVDRLRTDGYDFVDNDSDPRDEHGHGTHVAGIVAAVLNNNEGVAGLAPGVTILPVRVMDARGRGSDRAIARGIRFSADKGAKVINLSLGATLTLNADEPSALVNDAIIYAQQQGALVVVAAGNDAVPLPNAIAVDNPDVLVVAATDERDRKAPFSNSGPWVAVSAPGVYILSTMPTYEVFLTSDRLPPDERFQRNYDYMSGTSQATPYVAALAALLFSANPDWSPAQVAETIRSNATNIRDLNPRFELGTGRIDACKSFGGPPAESAPQPAPSPSTVRSESILGLLALCICGIVLALVIMTLTFIRGGAATCADSCSGAGVCAGLYAAACAHAAATLPTAARCCTATANRRLGNTHGDRGRCATAHLFACRRRDADRAQRRVSDRADRRRQRFAAPRHRAQRWTPGNGGGRRQQSRYVPQRRSHHPTNTGASR